MGKFYWTDHALKQIASRGIPRDVVEFAITHGRRLYTWKKCGVWGLDKGNILFRARSYEEKEDLVKYKMLRVVVAKNNIIVTAYIEEPGVKLKKFWKIYEIIGEMRKEGKR